MPVQFTKEQQQAIETRGRDILVSAAAGSGKTAVLTERIIRHVTDDTALTGPTDIDKLLVVTFTEAAAAEMRERIAAKLDDRLAQNPRNLRLQRQKNLLPSASVSTIHAFCRRLVREHFQRVDLDPAFKVGDNAEMSLLRAQVMTDLLEEEYGRENNDDFLDLVEAFGSRTRDDRLDQLVRNLFDFIESCPYPEQAAQAYVDVFTRGAARLDDTPWAAVVRDEISVGLAGALECVRMAQSLCRCPDGPEKYLTALQNDEAYILSLIAQMDKPFDELHGVFAGHTHDRLYAYRAKDDVSPTLKERVKELRDKEVKDRLKKINENYFFTTPEKMRKDIAALCPRVKALMALVLRFRQKYGEEKKSRNVLDFSDLEHYAIQVLSAGAEGTIAPVRRFHEVLIDEYQDSNAVQEWILSAVAGTAATRFMVGDVKQSVYRFRRANPGLFIDKYEKFARLSPDAETGGGQPPSGNFFATLEDGAPVRIDLTRNFRSRSEVIHTVNFFFSQLMSSEVGEVAYDAQAALFPGADYPGPPEGISYSTIVELAEFIPVQAEKASIPDEASPARASGATYENNTPSGRESEPPYGVSDMPETPSTGIEPDEVTKIDMEACVIAKHMHRLAGRRMIWDAGRGEYRPCRYGDMVILTRSVSSVAAALTEALKKYDIDAVADLTTGFFETLEIKTALSFLRVVDNPRQDIDLITVLHCPVYAFTPDELVEIRGRNAEADYYDCLKAYAEAAEATPETRSKAQRFLNDVNRWRDRAAYLPVSRLIGVIYDDTRYPAYAGAMPGGRIRQANLRLLMERAYQYEETSFKGLFHFVRYIERLRDTGADVSISAAAQEHADAEDRVRVMTIHKSKGLEFPVVFVSLLGRTMNREDERRNVVLHQEHGLGPVYIDLETRTKSNTLARLALSRLARRESLSEELRVLYVALTRAKEMLILTGCVTHLEEKKARWASMAHCAETLLPVYYRRECKSYLDWLMPCLARHRDGGVLHGDDAYEAADSCVNSTVYEHPARFAVCLGETPPAGEASPVCGENAAALADPLSLVCIGLPTEAEALPVDKPIDKPVVLQALDYPYAHTGGLPSKVSISELKRLYALETSPDSTPLLDEQTPVYEAPVFIKAEQGITALRKGTVLHTVAEHIDLHAHRTRADIDALILRLTEQNLLTPEEAAAVDRTKMERFVQSAVADRMRASARVYREVPFVMGLSPGEVYPYRTFTPEEAKEVILVHGIIDCYFEEAGQIVLVDYKSDAYVSHPQQWAERHRVQMNIYKKAVTRATGKAVSEALLYSFALDDTVPVEE